MPRVLLLMSTQSYRAGAFLAAAKRLGVERVVAGERPQALAFVHPTGHVTLDFDDPHAACERIVAFAQRTPLDAVIAADDDGAPIAALAAERLGLPHAPFAAVYAARSKLRLREAQRRAGEPTPWFRAVPADHPVDQIAGEVECPCVVKPVHLAASRGVMRADDPAALVAAIGRLRAMLARPDAPRLWTEPHSGEGSGAEILVEEYRSGIEVAVEGLVTRGRLRVLAVFDKPDPLVGPTFEETIYVTPSRLAPATVASVIRAVEGTLRALGLDTGPVHAEVRIDARGAWLVEIAPRSIGGLCSRTLRFGDGVSLEELLLRHALGHDTESFELAPGAAGVMMIPIPYAGTLRAIHGRDSAAAVPGIEDVRIMIPVGQEVVPLPEGARYLGFLFARGRDPASVESALRGAHAALRFDIEAREGAGDPWRAWEGAAPKEQTLAGGST